MSYSVEYSETASKFLDKITQKEATAILQKVNYIRNDPFPHLKRLKGIRLWRLRVGPFRVIIDVKNEMIFVVTIGYRKNIYDNI